MADRRLLINLCETGVGSFESHAKGFFEEMGVAVMRMQLIRFLAIVASALIATSSAWAQDTLQKIKQKGVIVVGVKNDYKPFGFLDPSGKIIGMEIDMAEEIAAKLGVKLELVPTVAANRVEYLQQGRTDLILSTMSDNPQRRAAVGVVDPHYYSGGSALLTRKDSGINKWEDVRGKRICGSQGAYYNRLISDRYGAVIVAFAGVAEAHNALLAGDCVGFLQDSTLHASAVSEPRWKDYHSPLPVEDEVGWNIAVPLAERDGPYGQFIKAVIIEWHKSGRLIELEKKWNLTPASPLVAKLHAEYKGK